MPTQTSTTGDLEAASREMIAQAIFTEEHNAPMMAIVPKFQLRQGEDTGVFPKFGQMSMARLQEGQDIVDSQDLGMTSVPVTTSEIGAKVILTDKLLRHNVAANWRGAGEQLGDAAARIENEDIVALFSGLNGGTDIGAAGRAFTSANAVSIIGFAKHNKFGNNLVMVHHPSAILRLARDLNVIGAATYQGQPIPPGFSAERLASFWTGIRISTVPFFETGDISLDSVDDAIGVIMNRRALGILRSTGWQTKRQEDISLRGTELVMVADYAAFEHDDAVGAPVTMDAAEPATT